MADAVERIAAVVFILLMLLAPLVACSPNFGTVHVNMNPDCGKSVMGSQTVTVSCDIGVAFDATGDGTFTASALVP